MVSPIWVWFGLCTTSLMAYKTSLEVSSCSSMKYFTTVIKAWQLNHSIHCVRKGWREHIGVVAERLGNESIVASGWECVTLPAFCSVCSTCKFVCKNTWLTVLCARLDFSSIPFCVIKHNYTQSELQHSLNCETYCKELPFGQIQMDIYDYFSKINS